MAKAEKTTITKQVVQTVETPAVAVTLSMDEALALRDVLNRVGGPPETSRRGLIQSIGNALEDAGVPAVWQMPGFNAEVHSFPAGDIDGSLWFEPEKPRLGKRGSGK